MPYRRVYHPKRPYRRYNENSDYQHHAEWIPGNFWRGYRSKGQTQTSKAHQQIKAKFHEDIACLMPELALNGDS